MNPPPLAQIVEIVALQLGRERVDPGDRLLEDLEAESADLVNLAAAIEDRFAIAVAEEELADVVTVGDLHRLVVRRL